MNITLFRNGQNDGPFTLDQVRAQIKGGVLAMGDPAWMEGWSEWKTVMEIPGLHESPAPSLPAVPVDPVAQKLNINGSVCPNCGNRNSYRKTDGMGCLVMGILFVCIIGIFLIPFLPKSWHCRSCGNVWK
jgi:hypothetical protein